MPIAVAIPTGLDVGPIWLGVISVISDEIGLPTPPSGIAVSVIGSALGPDPGLTVGQVVLELLGVLAFVFLPCRSSPSCPKV